MTTDTQIPDRLAQLGEALDHAVRADLAAHAPAAAHARTHGERVRRPRRLPRTRRFALGAAAAAVLVPAAAVAATELISNSQVAASLPQGTQALIGTNPSCTVVTAGVEYHCVLASAPSIDGAPTDTSGNPQWLGTVEDTVDATKHVNGGCRSQNQAGTDWECYIGQVAVQQKIISEGFLGQYAPSPGAG
jgi:hypothetical protein